MSNLSQLKLGTLTALAMATSTFPLVVVSVLAPQLIDEFEVSRAQLGFLFTANAAVGAIASPTFGRITDALGSVRSVVGTFVVSAITLVAWALSPTYAVLVLAAVATGFPNAWGNPATNALIVDNTSPGTRGVITGIKQSGVQFGTFLGGMLLPLFAGWWSWRSALLVFLVLPIGGLIGIAGSRDTRHHHELDESRSIGPTPPAVRWIALYGFISGFATQAIIGFVPLFANEEMGWSAAAAGTLISIVGLMGIGARLYWPRLAERSIGHGPALRILAWLTTGAALLLWLASLSAVGSWVMIPAMLLLGGGAVAWNAVGMLAVMDFSPHGLVGKGTGLVLFGFLLGLALGPPAMGYSVDRLNTYAPGWLTTAVLFTLAGVIASRVSANTPTPTVAP